MEQSIVIPLSELFVVISIAVTFVYKILEKRITTSEQQLKEMNYKSDMVTKELTEALTKSNLEFTSFISSQTEINKQILKQLDDLENKSNGR